MCIALHPLPTPGNQGRPTLSASTQRPTQCLGARASTCELLSGLQLPLGGEQGDWPRLGVKVRPVAAVRPPNAGLGPLPSLDPTSLFPYSCWVPQDWLLHPCRAGTMKRTHRDSSGPEAATLAAQLQTARRQADQLTRRCRVRPSADGSSCFTAPRLLPLHPTIHPPTRPAQAEQEARAAAHALLREVQTAHNAAVEEAEGEARERGALLRHLADIQACGARRWWCLGREAFRERLGRKKRMCRPGCNRLAASQHRVPGPPPRLHPAPSLCCRAGTPGWRR